MAEKAPEELRELFHIERQGGLHFKSGVHLMTQESYVQWYERLEGASPPPTQYFGILSLEFVVCEIVNRQGGLHFRSGVQLILLWA